MNNVLIGNKIKKMFWEFNFLLGETNNKMQEILVYANLQKSHFMQVEIQFFGCLSGDNKA